MKHTILIIFSGFIFGCGCGTDDTAPWSDASSSTTTTSSSSGTGGKPNLCGENGTVCPLEGGGPTTGICFQGECVERIPVTCQIVDKDPAKPSLFVKGCDGKDGIDAVGFPPHGVTIYKTDGPLPDVPTNEDWAAALQLCTGKVEEIGFCDNGDSCAVTVVYPNGGPFFMMRGTCYLANSTN